MLERGIYREQKLLGDFFLAHPSRNTRHAPALCWRLLRDVKPRSAVGPSWKGYQTCHMRHAYNVVIISADVPWQVWFSDLFNRILTWPSWRHGFVFHLFFCCTLMRKFNRAVLPANSTVRSPGPCGFPLLASS